MALCKDCSNCQNGNVVKSGIVYCKADGSVKGGTIQKFGCVNYKANETNAE